MTSQVASIELRSRVYDVTVVILLIFRATFPFHTDELLQQAARLRRSSDSEVPSNLCANYLSRLKRIFGVRRVWNHGLSSKKFPK